MEMGGQILFYLESGEGLGQIARGGGADRCDSGV